MVERRGMVGRRMWRGEGAGEERNMGGGRGGSEGDKIGKQGEGKRGDAELLAINLADSSEGEHEEKEATPDASQSVEGVETHPVRLTQRVYYCKGGRLMYSLNLRNLNHRDQIIWGFQIVLFSLSQADNDLQEGSVSK